MLDAFNTKGVRRLLTLRTREHLNHRNEDAVTSMVFTPLKFMDAGEVRRCVELAVGSPLSIQGELSSVVVELWPSGMSSASWGGKGHMTRCEPDLLVTFEGTTGWVHSVIGEMKWDSQPSGVDLGEETRRQREAVLGRHAAQNVTTFALVKATRPEYRDLDAAVSTWRDFHRRLERHAKAAKLETSSLRWAKMVAKFLDLAEQTIFVGFKGHYDLPQPANKGGIFYGSSATALFSCYYGSLPEHGKSCIFYERLNS